MKRAAGFTLIELVIVIVILGILGAVAAPKFLNLQDDAYAANISSLKGSIQSAMTLANTKAVLDNKDQGTGVNDVDGYKDVVFDYGYPIAADDNTGILGALQDLPSTSDYALTEENGELTIQPQGRKTDSDACFVRYTQATSAAGATVTSDNNCG